MSDAPEFTPEQEGRDETGRWKPGVSGNPGGRPPVSKRIRELAQSKADRMIELLEELALSGESESARIAAMKEILDRAVGKATQPISGSDDPDKPPLLIERVIIDPKEGT